MHGEQTAAHTGYLRGPQQERQKVRVGATSFLILMRASGPCTDQATRQGGSVLGYVPHLRGRVFMMISTRDGCTSIQDTRQAGLLTSFGDAMASLESITFDASPSSGPLATPSGQVQLSRNVRPLNAATRFSMTTAQTTLGSSNGDYNVLQGGISMRSKAAHKLPPRHPTSETCHLPFSKQTNVKMSCRGVLCIDTHADKSGRHGPEKFPSGRHPKREQLHSHVNRLSPGPVRW